MPRKPKSRVQPPPPPPKDAKIRPVLIHLKAVNQDQIDRLESVHRKTYMSKSTIVRLALAQWAKANDQEPFPIGTPDDDEEPATGR